MAGKTYMLSFYEDCGILTIESSVSLLSKERLQLHHNVLQTLTTGGRKTRKDDFSIPNNILVYSICYASESCIAIEKRHLCSKRRHQNSQKTKKNS
jgi:hypothetical protein